MAGAITSGMDVAQVRALAAELKRAADDMKRIGTQVTARLASTPWAGADRTRFEGDWNGRQRQQINQVAAALDEASATATRNASEQETASGR